MENQYTIDQLASICKVSKQSCYSFIKKHKAFIDENSTRNHRIIYYNQAVLDCFTAYYQPEQAPSNPGTSSEVDEKADNSPSVALPTAEERENQITVLKAKIDALEAEIGALRKQLDASEEERRELLRQNGAILLVLQQEQQEKKLYLPAPKKSLTERVKSFFHKDQPFSCNVEKCGFILRKNVEKCGLYVEKCGFKPLFPVFLHYNENNKVSTNKIYHSQSGACAR